MRTILSFLLCAALCCPAAFGGAASGGTATGTALPIGSTLSSQPVGGTWLAMNGQIVSQATYPALFNVIGHRPEFVWTQTPSVVGAASNFTPLAIAFGAGVYVAVGTSGQICTSPDLLAWTGRTSGVATVLNTVAFGNGVFAAAGASGVVLTSADGTTWSAVAGLGSIGTVLNMVYVHSIFYAATSTGFVVYSADGATWHATTQLSASFTFGTVEFYALNQWWIFPSGNPATAHGIAYSADGSTWTLKASITVGTEEFIGFDSTYVYLWDPNTIFGDNGGEIWRSSDGNAWTKLSATAQSNNASQCHPAFDGTGFLSLFNGVSLSWSTNAFTSSSQANVQTSATWPINTSLFTTNALQWIPKYMGLGNNFIVAASGTQAFISVDGKSWYTPLGATNLLGLNTSTSNASGGSNTTIIGQVLYVNGKYFLTNGNSRFYYATEPYTPSTQFQLPTQVNSDGTFRYVRAL